MKCPRVVLGGENYPDTLENSSTMFRQCPREIALLFASRGHPHGVDQVTTARRGKKQLRPNSRLRNSMLEAFGSVSESRPEFAHPEDSLGLFGSFGTCH